MNAILAWFRRVGLFLYFSDRYDAGYEEGHTDGVQEGFAEGWDSGEYHGYMRAQDSVAEWYTPHRY